MSTAPITPTRLRELLRFAEDRATDHRLAYPELQAYRDITVVLRHQLATPTTPGPSPCPTQPPR